MSDQNHYVYALYEKGNPKIRYIGVTVNPKRRLNAHLNANQYDSNEHKKRWIAKVNRNIGMRIIKSSLSKGEAYDLEEKLISLGRSKGIDLVNIHNGGEAPFKISDQKKWPWQGKRTPISGMLSRMAKTARELKIDGLMVEYEKAKKAYSNMTDEQKLIANMILVEKFPAYATWKGQIKIGNSMYPSKPIY